jgi:hypothetical protein
LEAEVIKWEVLLLLKKSGLEANMRAEVTAG